MFVKVSAVIVLLAVANVHAGILDDVKGVSSDVSNYFTTQFESAKDLFSNNQSELEKNVEKVKELLIGLKEKAKHFDAMGAVTDAQKATLNKVDEYLAKINEFQAEVKEEGAAKFEENKGKWQQMVDDIFDKGGLNNVVKLLNGSSPLSFISVAIAPIFYMIFVR